MEVRTVLRTFKLMTVITAITIGVSGCVVYPEMQHYESECNGRAHRLVLKAEVVEGACTSSSHSMSSGEQFAACVTFMAAVGAASALVSGSIMVVGNTVFWLQKEGECMAQSAS